jgi:hypothetical protein
LWPSDSLKGKLQAYIAQAHEVQALNLRDIAPTRRVTICGTSIDTLSSDTIGS